MKKALSIILCLAMLVSTVPMSVFAAPAAVTTGDSAFETVNKETQENKAELSEETTYSVTYSAGYRSALKDGKTDNPGKSDLAPGTEYTIPLLNNPIHAMFGRYQLAEGFSGYKLDGKWTDGTNVYAPGEKFVVNENIVLVPNVVPEDTAYTVKLFVDEKFDECYDGIYVISVAAGEALDLTDAYFAIDDFTGYNVLGWRNKATGQIVTSVTGAADDVIELEAAFEQVTGIVIDNPAKAAKLEVISGTGAFDGLSQGLLVTPEDSNPAVAFGGLALDAVEFSSVEVTYVRSNALAEANGGKVYFMLSTEEEINAANVATGELKSQSGDLVVYKYNLAANAAWAGTCSAIEIAPFERTDEFVISEIKFIKNTPVEAVELTNLAAPATSEVPDEAADVPSGANYAVESITWSPEADYFKGSTVYTATIVVKADTGYMFTDDTVVTVNGESADVDVEAFAATITKTYAETTAPVDVNVVLTSASVLTSETPVELTASVTPVNDTDVVAPTTVTWAITGGKEGAATLEGNILTPKLNGEVKVTATPDYDPSQAEEFTITIEGLAVYEVTFDKNTSAAVTGLPTEAVETRGVLDLSSYVPAREGYGFGGWMLDAEGGEVVNSVNVTAPVTVYAMWTKGGYFNDFDNPEITANAAGTGVNLTGGYSLGTDTRYTEGLVANPEEGYVSAVLGGTDGNHNDHRLDFNVGTSNATAIDVSKSDEIILGLRSDISGVLNFVIRYTTKDADGNWIAEENNGAVATADNPYLRNSVNASVTLTGDINTVTELKLDMSKVAVWDGFLQHIRFANNNNANYVGKTIYYDYIKIPGAETVEHLALDIEAPVAADVAYGLEAVTADSDKFIATGIAWGGSELLGGMYYDSAKAYTAKVEIEAAGAYALSDAPATVTVNGEEAAVVVEDGKYFVEYTFPATEDVGTLELVDVTLHEQNDEGAATETKQVFKNRDVDLGIIHPTNLRSGNRWIGWSLTEGGEAIEGTVNLDAPTDYYALYEVIDEYDFSNEYHKNAENIKATDGLVTFDGAWTVVTPKSSDSNATLTLDGMYITAANYDFVEVIYDGSLEEAGYDNKFMSPALVPALKVNGAGAESCIGVLTNVEPLIANNRVAYKYTYDISNGKPSIITSFELAPYKGKPAWAVTSVKLIENEAIASAVKITGLAAPETWAQPDTEAAASENYEVVSVEWDGVNGFNADGSFKAGSEYTVTIVVKPATGYSITIEEARIGTRVADSAVLGADGKLTITETFPATEALVEFTLTVADATIDVSDGKVTLVPVFTPVNEGETVVNQKVTWEIVSNGPESKSASIDANGVVTAHFNAEGDDAVVVRATSEYNSYVFAEAKVTIINQVESYPITFNKNTSGAVSNMPAEGAQAKLDYVLPKSAPVREGFIFIGWAKSPDSYEIVEKDIVTAPTTYYAKWTKDGYINSFNDEGNTLSSATKVSFADGGYFGTDARYMSDLTVNTEEGYVSTKLGGTAGHYGDYRMNMYVPAGKVDISNIDKFVVGLRSDTAGSMPFLIRYGTKDAYGNWIGPDEGTDVETYKANSFWTSSVSFSGDVNEVVELVVDMSEKGAWDGFLDHIRFCINNHSSMLGATIYFDYFRAYNYETSTVEITDVVAPVAKAAYSTNANEKDPSKYEITNVEWEGELLYDYYFGGNTEYTVCVTVKGANGYFMSDAPTKVTINGKNAEIGDFNNSTGELTIKYTFAPTGDLANSDAYDITLYGMDDDGEYVEETRTIFDGDAFALGSYAPISTPSGKRWIGWSDEEGATESNVGATIVVDGPMTFYAVFEDLVEFNYSNPLHRVGTTVKNGTLVYEDGLAVVTPSGSASEGAIVTPVMNVSGADFGLVEVYYNTMLESTHNKVFYENIFSAQLKPSLKFSLTSEPDAIANAGTLVSAERAMVDGISYFKYTYDMSASSAWVSGNVAKLQLTPYKGYPIWGLGLIKLIPNVETSATAEFEVTEPETWTSPSEPVCTSDEYEIVSYEWTPAANIFAPEEEYTLAVTYKPVVGYKAVSMAAEINGEAAFVTDNGNGTFTASYLFSTTDALMETEVVITGPDAITSRGRYIQLKAKTVAVDGSKLPVTGVTWTIESVDTDTELARISEGRVFPVSNGTVLVTATSVYDPSVSATHEIEITNQAELVAITFDKNTQAEVTGIPEDAVYAYGDFDPDAYLASIGASIKRDGFYLSGWSTDPDALNPDATFNITKDTTLYAKWGKGHEINFNDAANAPKLLGTNTMIFADGIGTLTYNNLDKARGQVLSIEGLRNLGLEASAYKTIEVKLSSSIASSFLIFFRGSDGVSNEGYTDGAYQYNTGVAIQKMEEGKFQTATIDFSSRTAWTEKPYLNNIRIDFSPAPSENAVLLFDYIRIPNNTRTVKLDGNGGLVPYLNGEVASFKQSVAMGTMNLPAAPVKEGYDFLGWSKVLDADENTKLYNGKFNVTDDVTLYAIWGPEGSAGSGSGEEGGYSSSDATTSEGGQATTHPGHVTYPTVGGGTVSSNDSYTKETPTDKKVSVPARPKDDGPLAMGAGNILPEKFKKSTTYDGRFKDIKRSDWFYNDVDTSFELGLMNGKSGYEFAPNGTVTVAEAVTVAARMNAIYFGRQVYGGTGATWYVPYVDYAIANSIIKAGEYSDYKAPATREQVAMIFIKALPGSWYPKKNMFSNIPDIAKGSDIEATLLKLYNAGIVTGVDDTYKFNPSENIKRSELSAIINRVALPDSRLRVVTEEEKKLRNKTFTGEDIIANAKNMNVANSVEAAFKLKNGGAWAEPAKADPWSGGWHTLFEDGFVNADEFKIITVVIKPDDPAAVVGAGGSKFYFAFDGKYTDAIAVATKVPAAAEDGTITLVYDMSQHAMWAGEVTTLRYDPYDNATPYAIISVTFAPKD